MAYSYTSGLGNVGAYQVSGKPFATSSITVPGSASEPIEITFPTVTRSITIRNDHASLALRVGFSAHGTKGSENDYYFTLAAGVSWQEDIKVESVFLLSNVAGAGEATVIAGLTGIPTTTITENFSGSAGIG
jgi:hypothetical protein